MNCKSLIETLDDYADGTLSRELNNAANAHLAQCVTCQSELARHTCYLQLMRRISVPEPTPGTLAQLLRQTVIRGEMMQQKTAPPYAFIKGFATAAMLAIVSMAGLWQFNSGGEAETAGAVAATISEHALTREVTVVINVPATMLAADLSLDFPASLRLEGLEDLQRVAWQVDLEQGSNLLTLPVTVAAGTNLADPLSILATVSYAEQRKDFRLPVQLLAPAKPQPIEWYDVAEQRADASGQTWSL